MAKVFVTGLGIISAIGIGIEETMKSVMSLKSGIGNITLFDSIHKGILPVAEVKYSNNELTQMIGQTDILSRTTRLGLIAAKQAVESAKIEKISNKKTGLISATSVGGMLNTEEFFKEYVKDRNSGNLKYVLEHECGDSTEKIADVLGIKDYITTFSTACSSSANAIMFGARLIKNAMLDRVIVGGSDSLCRFTINGFNSLMIIDKSGCHPFDEHRQGLTLGEGAAYLVLESERSVGNTLKNVLCEIKGFGNACDAYHQTASSPEGIGPLLAMKLAIAQSGLALEDISYINAHGTGTPNNDLSEGLAIESLFSGKIIPPISSTKAFTGHTLAASGSIESVLSILAINNQMLLPNLGYNSKMKEVSFAPNDKIRKDVVIKNVLKNSFGFGGNNTSLIFSRC